MASLVSYKGGLRRIEFAFSPNEKRRAIYLGRVSAKAARAFKSRVEEIIGDRLATRPHDPELSKWLASRDEKTLAKLRRAGLADGVGLADVTLGAFMDKLFKTMAVKPSTRGAYEPIRKNLEMYFTPDRLVRTIGPAGADAWRAWLVKDQKLSTATVSRRVIAARTFWRRAVRWRLASENPFEGLRSGLQVNDDRRQFIPAEDIEKVIAEAPDAEWRALVALARYGALRVPSEVFALRWIDVDWAEGTILIRSSKTAHVEGGATRTIPMFPQLRRWLMDAFEDAEDGATHVVTRRRWAAENLRTTFAKLVQRAGLEIWPRPFGNLRASRESELLREFDLATVARWVGHSREVCARHYATSCDLDADFARAVAGSDSRQQKRQQNGPEQRCTSVTPDRADCEKHPENKGDVAFEHAGSQADKPPGRSRQDSNLQPLPPEGSALSN